MRAALREASRQAARPGGSAVTSAAVLLLILVPAVAVVTGAEALPQRQRDTGVKPGGDAPPRAAATPDRQKEPGHVLPAGAVTGPVAGHATATPGQVGDKGVHLLREAAAASRSVSYRGVQIVSWWGPAGTTTTVVKVTHRQGHGTLLRTANTGAGPAGESFIEDEPGAQPGDVLGVTEETLGLLVGNYRVIAAGSGSACGRPAAVVDARRADGTIAARFWLDSVTKIPLRRELFDHRSRMINVNTFIDLDLGRRAARSLQDRPAAASRPWKALTATVLARLRAVGWPLPVNLPGGLTLFSARQATTRSGTVLQLGYSDGLSGMSLFVQRGGLPRKLAGWHRVKVGGWPVFGRGSMDRGLTWSSHGHVFTLIADAPTVTINAVVRALPHDPRPGFLARLRHGFGRLVSWVDPFR